MATRAVAPLALMATRAVAPPWLLSIFSPCGPRGICILAFIPLLTVVDMLLSGIPPTYNDIWTFKAKLPQNNLTNLSTANTRVYCSILFSSYRPVTCDAKVRKSVFVLGLRRP
jgi:hypothetical protein